MADPITSADYRIKSAVVTEGHRVKLTWSNGEVTTADFSRYVGSGVFEKFNDPVFFAKVKPKRNGYVLAWPDDLDFSADDLWYEAHPQDLPRALRPFYPANTFRNLDEKSHS